MEHTQVVTATELESYAATRESESVIPELISLLVRESARDDLTVCRIPYGDAVNQPGWDGLVETEKGFGQFLPKKKSFWEIGTGASPQSKATKDFKKRTRNMALNERQEANYVFVTPYGAGSGGWNEPAQTKWITRRNRFGWKKIKILDADQLADWLREFPAIGKWLLKKMGLVKRSSGFSTPAEHWDNLKALPGINEPALPAKVFLDGRSQALSELERLFRGESSMLVLAVENELDAEDFVAAFLSSLDDTRRRAFSNRCLFISDADAWITMAKLRTAHVLVAHPKLDLESSGEQLHMEASKNHHAVVIPVSGGWARGSENVIRLPSPSANVLETTLTEGGFKSDRARELAAAGALSLASLKRHLRGLGELPPYATWANARALAQAGLLGRWAGENAADRAAVELALGKAYGEWIETVRPSTLRPDTPLTQSNENWKVLSRGESWGALGPQLTNEDLDRFQQAAVLALSERDPKFELAPEKRFAANIHGKVIKHSSYLRYGVAETLALMGARPNALSSCSQGKPELIAILTVRELLREADWVGWASLDRLLPLLAEAAPEEFLRATEDALLNLSESPFRELFAQERAGITGQNLLTGLLWALETLAWQPDYLLRVTMILGEMAEIDPGGNWANRPANSIVDILRPWYPQTCASHSKRKVAVEALLREHCDVGWKVLLALLPKMHDVSTGTRKPAWRHFIPAGWSETITVADYRAEVADYADLAVATAATDLPKLTELIDHLPNVPTSAQSRLLEHIASPAVVGLLESDRQALWESLVDLAAKHRKFIDAQWAMPEETIVSVEDAAAKISPKTASAVYRRLFSDRDFQLFEEKGDYEEQRRNLDLRRKAAISEILSSEGVAAVLTFAHKVPSPAKVGYALGSIESQSVDDTLLPEYLDSPDTALSALIAAFVATKFWNAGWQWVDELPTGTWSVEQKVSLLTLVPATKDTWERAEQLLGSEARAYWKKAGVNPWAEEEDVLAAVDKLLQNDRPKAALSSLNILIHKKTSFPPDLAVRTLRSLLSSGDTTSRVDQYDVLELIKWLQENPHADLDVLAEIEWAYLPWLIREEGAEPKTLEQAMATDPKFFCEIIRIVFRSKKEESAERARTDLERNNAQNAFRLLHNWRTVPGSQPDGAFNDDAFMKWILEVKQIADASGHLEVAMGQVGEVLASAPADPQGLWINRTVARALDAKDAEKMRSGFMRGRITLRGVYWGTGGEEERKLAADYRAKAETLDEHGYPRFAGTVRDIAKSFEREAEREALEEQLDD